MTSEAKGNTQGTGNEAKSQKFTVPSFRIAVLIGKRDRHKDKGYAVPRWRVSLQVMLPIVLMENPDMHLEEIEQYKM